MTDDRARAQAEAVAELRERARRHKRESARHRREARRLNEKASQLETTNAGGANHGQA